MSFIRWFPAAAVAPAVLAADGEEAADPLCSSRRAAALAAVETPEADSAEEDLVASAAVPAAEAAQDADSKK